MPDPQKNIILYLSRTVAFGKNIEQFREKFSDSYRFALLYQDKPKSRRQTEMLEQYDLALRCNMKSSQAITKTLLPYQDQLLAITCRADSNISLFQKVIPHVPYLRTPTTESLSWATDKLQMRKRFTIFDRSITPQHIVVSDAKKNTLKEVEEKVGFPLVIKPNGLAKSMLVTVAYHAEELETSLKRVFRKINKLHRTERGRGEASVLVERFIDGEMYSVDAYVTSRGKLYFTPFCHIKTGRSVGYDDFFAYQTTTPATLNKQSVADAQRVSTTAARALGLRSTTVHIELFKTESGWKVIEIGPRIGGFRDVMYRLSFGIDHGANDFLIRIPKTPHIPRKVRGHSVVLKFFAKREGRITNISGIKKAQRVESFHDIKIQKKIGDRATYAKNGGDSIFNIYLFHTDRSKLLADVRRLEKMINIKTA